VTETADPRSERRRAISKLRDELDGVDGKLEILYAVRDELTANLNELEAEEEACEVEATIVPATRPGVSDVQLRDICTRLMMYTIPELVSVVGNGVKPAAVKRAHATFLERKQARATKAKSHGQIVYEWVKADEAGAAFEAQQRADAEVRERSRTQLDYHGGLVTGGIAGTGSQLADRIAKPIRKVARKAMEQGWELREQGDGHFRLERDGYKPLTIPSTPRSATAAAVSLEAQVRNATAISQQP
jgi:hypothetical protein